MDNIISIIYLINIIINSYAIELTDRQFHIKYRKRRTHETYTD